MSCFGPDLAIQFQKVAWRKTAPCPTQAEHAYGMFSDPGDSWASLGQVVTVKLGELSGSDLGTRLTPIPCDYPSGQSGSGFV